MAFVYDDGGREAAGFKGEANDCVCRAISIATGEPYRKIYKLINNFAKYERIGKKKKTKSNAKTGVYKFTIRKVMEYLGWQWTPTVTIGSGCKVHLCADDLPPGNIIVSLSNHCAAVIDGVLHDTYDSSCGGTRCVYGYFQKK